MYQQQRDEIKKALGGVPGQVGVMVNGVYVKFPDAAPEVAGGRTMVPVPSAPPMMLRTASLDASGRNALMGMASPAL